MAVIIFVAMFLGSLLAAIIAFSGWPLWFAFTAYLLCGMTGLGLIVLSGFFHPTLSRGMARIRPSFPKFRFWKKQAADYFEPQHVPDLSEYLFSSTRNRR